MLLQRQQETLLFQIINRYKCRQDEEKGAKPTGGGDAAESRINSVGWRGGKACARPDRGGLTLDFSVHHILTGEILALQTDL